MRESPYFIDKDGNGRPTGSSIKFWIDTAKNEALSAKEGRPVFDEVHFVRITSPGARQQEIDHEILRKDIHGSTRKRPRYDQYGDMYEAWMKNEANPELMGTPLDAWPRLDASMIATMKYLNIHTLEALRAVPDSQLSGLGPNGRELREAAKAFLEAAAGNAPVERLTRENEALRNEMASLRQQFAEIAEKRGPGRPPKVRETEAA